jgi:CRP-like cAMP-binding protein
MYIIDEGAAVCQIDGQVVSKYEKGRYFGELALQQNQPRAATIRADGATTCSILKAWCEKRL